MLRSLALFCLVAVFTAVFNTATTFAQNATPEREVVKATPEILALLDESKQSLTQVEPTLRAGALLRLLGFALHLDDKAPANRIIATLMGIIPNVEPEELRNQLYSEISHAFYALEEYASAVEVLQRITIPANRYRSQLELAIQIVSGYEQNDALRPFDASALLRQVISGATEAQDRNSMAFAYTLLGHELARQGRTEESATVFAEAIRVTRGMEDIGEQLQIVRLIIQSQVRYGQIEGARATSQIMDEPEIRRTLHNVFIHALIDREQYTEAERLIKTLPAEGAGRDMLIQRLIAASIETITDEKIGELSALLSVDFRARILPLIVVYLQRIDRGDVAVQVGNRLGDPAEAKMALFTGKLELLLERERFAEAIQHIDTLEEEGIKQHLKQHVLARQFSLTRDETLIEQILAVTSAEDKAANEELREDVARFLTVAEVDRRINLLLEVLQEQIGVMDIPGARQTAKVFAEQVEQLTELMMIVGFRLILANFQAELRDREGMTDNLTKLKQRLAVRDLSELRAIVGAAADDVDESALRRELFHIHVMMADLLEQVDATAESSSAFERAKALARDETNAVQKAEMLLVLAQFLAEQD